MIQQISQLQRMQKDRGSPNRAPGTHRAANETNFESRFVVFHPMNLKSMNF